MLKQICVIPFALLQMTNRVETEIGYKLRIMIKSQHCHGNTLTSLIVCPWMGRFVTCLTSTARKLAPLVHVPRIGDTLAQIRPIVTQRAPVLTMTCLGGVDLT